PLADPRLGANDGERLRRKIAPDVVPVLLAGIFHVPDKDSRIVLVEVGPGKPADFVLLARRENCESADGRHVRAPRDILAPPSHQCNGLASGIASACHARARDRQYPASDTLTYRHATARRRLLRFAGGG